MANDYDFEALIRSIVREEIRLNELTKKETKLVVSTVDDWGSYTEAKSKTGLSRQKIQILIDSGKVEAYQECVGGNWHINISSILRYLSGEAKLKQKEKRRRATA